MSQLTETEKFVHQFRNKAKRVYAQRYCEFRAFGGAEPERGNLSYMAAQAVRIRYDLALADLKQRQA